MQDLFLKSLFGGKKKSEKPQKNGVPKPNSGYQNIKDADDLFKKPIPNKVQWTLTIHIN